MGWPWVSCGLSNGLERDEALPEPMTTNISDAINIIKLCQSKKKYELNLPFPLVAMYTYIYVETVFKTVIHGVSLKSMHNKTLSSRNKPYV